MLRSSGVGNIVRDCNLRHAGDNNVPVCSFTVAFNRNFKHGEDWKKETAFVECELWGVRAEKLESLLVKGQFVYVAGHMVTQSWESETKGKQSKLVLKVDSVDIINRVVRDDGNNNSNGNDNSNNNNDNDGNVADESMPF